MWSMVIIHNKNIKTWESIYYYMGQEGAGGTRKMTLLFMIDSPPYKQKLIWSPLLCTLHVSIATFNQIPMILIIF